MIDTPLPRDIAPTITTVGNCWMPQIVGLERGLPERHRIMVDEQGADMMKNTLGRWA